MNLLCTLHSLSIDRLCHGFFLDYLYLFIANCYIHWWYIYIWQLFHIVTLPKNESCESGDTAYFKIQMIFIKDVTVKLYNYPKK